MSNATKPKSSIYTIGGFVPTDGSIYVPREADIQLLELCRSHTFTYILTPRQMGKSSLMVRTAEQLKKEDIRSVIVDLNQFGTKLTEEQWYLGILNNIEEQLELETDVVAWWQAHKNQGVVERLTLFFKDVLLPEVKEPVVIFVDEIDVTLNLAFTDDFYAAIRYLYHARARQPEFKRLSFVLIGVAAPSDLIQDAKRTPFNIGQRVDLTDFTVDEALPLAEGLGLPLEQTKQLLGWVLDWTSGHPYLTQVLFRRIATRGGSWTKEEIDELVAKTFLREVSDINLQVTRDMLTKRAPDIEAALTIYKEILLDKKPVPDEEQSLTKSHLKLTGVVRRENGMLRVRNRIYREVFNEEWVKANLPVNWSKRLTRIATIAAAVLFIVSIPSSIFALYQWNRADDERALAVEARQKAEAQSKAADKAREEAIEQRRRAELSASKAEQAAKDAEAAKQQAEKQRVIAEQRQKEAESAVAREQVAKRQAVEQRQQAEMARNEERKLRDIVEERAKTDKLYREATSLYIKGDQQGAIEKFKDTIPSYIQTGDYSGEALTYVNIALAYENMKKPAEALSSYEKAIEAFQKAKESTGDASGEESAYSNIGKIHEGARDWEKAIAAYKNLLAYYFQHPESDKSGKAANTYEKLGALYNLQANEFTENDPSKREHKQKALENYVAAVKNYRSLPDRDYTNEGTLLERVANLYIGLKEKPKAIEFLKQARDAFKQAGNIAGEISRLRAIKDLYIIDLNQPVQAEEYFNQVIDEYTRAGDLAGKARTFSTVGDFYMYVDDLKAREYYTKALETYRSFPQRNYIEESRLLASVAGLYAESDKTRALDYHKQARAAYRQAKNSYLENNELETIGKLYDELNQPAQAEEYFNQVIAEYDQAGDLAGQARVRSAVGGFYRNDKYQKAIEHYTKALETYRSFPQRNYTDEANTLSNIASVYILLKDVPRAIDYNKQAYTAYKQAKNSYLEDSMLELISSQYRELNQPAQAEEYFNQVIAEYDQAGDLAGKGRTLLSVGAIYEQSNDYQKALGYYNQALLMSKKVGDPVGQALAHLGLARSHAELKDKQLAFENYNQAIGLYQLINRGDQVARGVILSINDLLNPNEKEVLIESYRQSARDAIKSPEIQANAHQLIGMIYRASRNKEMAFENFNAALTLYQRIGEPAAEARILTMMADYYDELKEKGKALESNKKAIQLYKKLGDYRSVATLLTRLGNISADMEHEYQLQTEEYFGQVIREYRDAGDLIGMVHLWTIVGDFYKPTDGRKAIEYYTNALQLQRGFAERNKVDEASLLLKTAELYDVLKVRGTALENYNQALTLYRELKDLSAQATTLIAIGKTYASLKDKQKAVESYNHARNIYKSLNRESDESSVQKLIDELEPAKQ